MPMSWFNTDSLLQRSLLPKDSLLSNVSDALSSAVLSAAKFAITGEKGVSPIKFIRGPEFISSKLAQTLFC